METTYNEEKAERVGEHSRIFLGELFLDPEPARGQDDAQRHPEAAI